ncbi:MAG: hypothetical protein AB4042_09415 [Leptolyngbyaceae cyanobacterium]
MDNVFDFTVTPQQYDPKKAYALALVSGLAYLKFEQDDSLKKIVREQAQEWGFKTQFFNQSLTDAEDSERYANDGEAIALIDDQTIIIGFRGTEQKWREWFFTNFNLGKVTFPEGKSPNPFQFLTGRGKQVHAGFYRLFDAMWHGTVGNPGIRDLLKGTNKQVWLTGHSLGGAIAVLTAAICQQESIPVAGVYTYGQPKVGNQNFTQSLNFDLFRLVNNNDIITRVPNLGYDHGGIERYFSTDGELLDRKNISFAESLGDRLRGRYYDLLDPGSDGLKDHAIGLWWDALGKPSPFPDGDDSQLKTLLSDLMADKDETYIALLKANLA